MKATFRVSLLFLTLAVTVKVFAGDIAPPLVSLRVEDAGPVLPSSGSSLFDKIFRKTDGQGQVVYDVPKTIPQVLQKILEKEGAKSAVTYSLLPLSRSLQRPIDFSYDPFLNPRLVTAFRGGGNIDINNKIFIGYVKPKDQLEVISYNEEGGRFEFQLVRHFSQNPTVFYANRTQCIACHQGQSPIFFRIPWAETTFRDRGSFNQRNSLIRDMVMLRNGATDLVSEKSDQLLIEKLFGAFPGINDAQKLEDSTDDADRIARAQRFWIYACGSSNACRLAMALHEIDPSREYQSLYKKYDDELQAQFLKSDLKGEKTYLPDIVSYDLETVLREYPGMTRFPYSFTDVGPTDLAAEALKKKDVLLSLIGMSSHLIGEQSPTTRRPTYYEEFFYAYAQNQYDPPMGFLPLDMINDLMSGTNITHQKMISELLALYQKRSDLFSANPFNVRKILYEVLNGLGEGKAKLFKETELGGPTPEKQVFSGALPIFFSDPTLMKFAKNCAACHSDPSQDFPPPFLVGPESQVQSQMTAIRPALIYKLENHLMPPDPAKQQALQNSGEYQELLAYVKKLAAP